MVEMPGEPAPTVKKEGWAERRKLGVTAVASITV